MPQGVTGFSELRARFLPEEMRLRRRHSGPRPLSFAAGATIRRRMPTPAVPPPQPPSLRPSFRGLASISGPYVSRTQRSRTSCSLAPGIDSRTALRDHRRVASVNANDIDARRAGEAARSSASITAWAFGFVSFMCRRIPNASLPRASSVPSSCAHLSCPVVECARRAAMRPHARHVTCRGLCPLLDPPFWTRQSGSAVTRSTSIACGARYNAPDADGPSPTVHSKRS